MKYLFKNARIIDGLGGVIENGWMLTDGPEIRSVGPCNGGDWPSGEEIEVMDVAGRTIMPGLIDCHVHLMMDSSPDPVTSLDNASIERESRRCLTYAWLPETIRQSLRTWLEGKEMQ